MTLVLIIVGVLVLALIFGTGFVLGYDDGFREGRKPVPCRRRYGVEP